MRKIFWVFGIGRGVRSGQPPSVVLQHSGLDMYACWPFRGQQGQVAIQLQKYVRIEHVAIDHVPFNISRDRSFAPRQVLFWGFKDDAVDDGLACISATSDASNCGLPAILIANMSYNAHSAVSFQHAPITSGAKAANMSFSKIVVSVQDNWGDEELTCLCGIHIYG